MGVPAGPLVAVTSADRGWPSSVLDVRGGIAAAGRRCESVVAWRSFVGSFRCWSGMADTTESRLKSGIVDHRSALCDSPFFGSIRRHPFYRFDPLLFLPNERGCRRSCIRAVCDFSFGRILVTRAIDCKLIVGLFLFGIGHKQSTA